MHLYLDHASKMCFELGSMVVIVDLPILIFKQIVILAYDDLKILSVKY
jgi:hypothetical protein